MDDLLEQFLIEGRELVEQANEHIAILRADPANAGAIDGAFRAVHTLKGSVAIFDMAPAERVLHAAEERLARARKAKTRLATDAVISLIASLDQVDRWIDLMEQAGTLGADAATIADRLLVGHDASNDGGSVIFENLSVGSPASWLDALKERQKASIESADEKLVAFRYAPDTEAFFRGDDPLALVATIPQLEAIDVLPAQGAWPTLELLEPFKCEMIIEGLSTAPLDELKTIFKLVPDQIELLEIPVQPTSAARVADLPQSSATSVLRVEAHRVDQLADDVGELVVATNAIAMLAERADRIDQGLALAIRAAQADLERAVGGVSRSVWAVRLVSLAPTVRRLPRLVREIAHSVSKTVSISVTGENLEVDKQIADGLFEPLLHLIRNGIDHGIEAETIRSRSGKPTEGQLRLDIAREGDHVVVSLADDGAGIDPAHIRDVAVDRQLITRNEADALPDSEALGLIFTPGFSTAATVTGVSGRGVGMDAVRSAIERLRGRIEIDSVIGRGTRFRLLLPANAITTSLLVVEVARDRYAVPFDQIAETVRMKADRLIPLATGTVCVLRDRTVPVLSLAELLGGEDEGSVPAKLLVTRAGGETIALRVDHFHERIDAMVRPPNGLLSNMPIVSGTAVLGDGAVLLVLNLPELVA